MIFFPDPWPKSRHHKRRLLAPEFLEITVQRLKRHGRLFIATDWDDYANAIHANLATPSKFSPRPAWRPLTRFERRGLRMGHAVREFAYGRI